MLQMLRQKHEAKKLKDYNTSFFAKMGSSVDETLEANAMWEQKWYKAPVAQVYENMREFELAHEKDADEVELYTGDAAFPDSYNHKEWLYHQQHKEEDVEWEQTKLKWKLLKEKKESTTHDLWKKLRKMQLIGVKQE